MSATESSVPTGLKTFPLRRSSVTNGLPRGASMAGSPPFHLKRTWPRRVTRAGTSSTIVPASGVGRTDTGCAVPGETCAGSGADVGGGAPANIDLARPARRMR
jgi:hypothetical protein